MTEAQAARASARTDPVMVELGSETYTFEPEMPLDIVLAYDTLIIDSERELRIWTVAHLLTDCPCDTSCADDGNVFVDRNCPAEKALRDRLRKTRIDGRRLSRDAYDEFHRKVLESYAVAEGESETSAESPATAGELSSGTPSEQESTSTASGAPAAAASAA